MVKIFTGTTIVEDIVPIHPFLAVIKAKQFVKEFRSLINDTMSWVTVSSNNIEYITYIQSYCGVNGIDIEWYLDGKLSTSEKVYADFDRGLDITMSEFKYAKDILN